MKNKRIIDSWNKIEPAVAAKERMLKHIIDRSDRRKRIVHWKPLAAVTAACLVLLVGVFVFNNIDTPDRSNKEEGTAVVDIEDLSDEVKGLPANDFKLSEIELNIAMDRVVFFDFLNIFEFKTDNFVIVKVADTKPVPAAKTEINEKQKSTVKVLETIWGDPVPEEVIITQYLYGGCIGDEVTNLLRKGGVYLLPLVKDKGDYYLVGDLDVLFEIDDEGRIWSHSDYPDFNCYDGEDYQVVTNEIMRIAQDDTLMLATSDFGK